MSAQDSIRRLGTAALLDLDGSQGSPVLQVTMALTQAWEAI